MTNSPGILFSTDLRHITIGLPVETLGPTSDKFFVDNKSITRIDCLNSTPPDGFTCESEVYSIATLNIPKGSLEEYKAHSVWGQFLDIAETFDPSGVDSVIADNIKPVVDVYNLQGVIVRKCVSRSEAVQGLPQGVYIVGGEKVWVE